MIIKIKGGLGNQMFQYAYGRSLEQAGKKVIFDTSFFAGNRAVVDTARNFKLDKFNLETMSIFSDRKHPFLDMLTKIRRKFIDTQFGLWQSERYFKDIESKIRQEFTLKNPLSPKSTEWKEMITAAGNSVSIHIRRGDYIQNNKTKAFHGVCDLAYYTKALEEVAEKLGDKIEVFIFSDDIIWAKENLKFPYPLNFVSGPEIPDYEEMYLMSLCKNNIIANSTFSWWGAWLNLNPNKIVVGPKQWFAKKISDEIDILPKSWIQI